MTTNLLYDETNDNNLRYVGNDPNNYIYFNNELWRIIGVMNNIENDGTSEKRVKIIRNESIGLKKWNDTIYNTWSTSTLAAYLNDEYFESIDDDSKSLIDLAKWNISALNFENNTYTFYKKERLNSNLSVRLC